MFAAVEQDRQRWVGRIPSLRLALGSALIELVWCSLREREGPCDYHVTSDL